MAIAYNRFTQADADANNATANAALARLSAAPRPSMTFRGSDRTRMGVRDPRYGSELNQWNQDWAERDKAQQAYASAQAAQAGNAQKLAETQVMDATYGRGNDMLNDSYTNAALDALKGQLGSNGLEANMFSKGSDIATAGAKSQADMLRQQMGRAGLSMNDPAAQAAMRGIETNRLTGINSAARDAAIAGAQNQTQAAGQLASARLSQQGMAQNAYSQGASMLAQKQFNQRFVSGGYQSFQ